MVKVQEYLNKNYPQEKRESIEELNISCRNLESHLDLSDFVNLTYLKCEINQLTTIDLSKNEKLERVELYCNNISADLSIFSHLTNLKKLDLGMDTGYSNDFYGSLKSLENLTNLEYLCIGQNKKITEGLEYLPTKNLTHFGCHGTIFEEILKPYGLGHKGLKAWKLPLLEEQQKNQILTLKIAELEQNISTLEKQKLSLTTERNQLQKANIDFTQKETELNEQISTITNEKNEFAERLAELERLRNEAAERIKNHKLIGTPKEEELAGKYQEVYGFLQHQISVSESFKTEKKSYEKSFARLENEKKDLNEKREKIASELSDLKNELVNNNRTLKEKEEKLTELQNNLFSLKKEKEAELSKLKTEFQGKEKTFNQQLESKRLELNQKEGEISKLQTEISEAKKTNSDLDSKLKEREELIKYLESDNEELNKEIKLLNKEKLTEQRKKNWALFGSAVQGFTTELLGEKWGKRTNAGIQVVSGAALLSNMGEWTYEFWLMGIGMSILFVVPKLYRALAPAVEKWTGIKLPGAQAVEKIENWKHQAQNSLDRAEQKAVNVVVNLGEQVKSQTDKLAEPKNSEPKEVNASPAESSETNKPEQILPEQSEEETKPKRKPQKKKTTSG